MGQPAGKRQPIDLDEFERRLRATSRSAAAPQEDPLAELARLVGNGPDPFAQLFAASRAQSAPPPPPPEPQMAAFDTTYDEPEPAHDRSIDEQVAAERAYYAAQGPAAGRPPAEPRAPARLGRRFLTVAGGALALIVAGGLGTLAMRGHIAAGGPPPTILASTAPVRVRPPNDHRHDPVGRSSDFLNDLDSPKIAPARVVNTEEEPIALSQLADRAGGGANSLLPRPHWVKTFSVRPDGSIISDGPPAAGSASAAPSSPGASAAPANPPSVATNAAPAPASAAPADKPAARSNPVMASADVAFAPAVAPAPPVKSSLRAPAQPAAPPHASPFRSVARMTTKSGKPLALVRVASRGPTPAAAPSPVPAQGPAPASNAAAAGNWAVQLAAPGTERAARLEARQLETRFAAALGGRNLVYRSAVSRGMNVWRVRAVGLAESAALAMCGRIKAAGGVCFVAKD